MNTSNNNLAGFLMRLRALLRKEFSQLIRDNSSLLMGIVLPLILIFIMGYGMSLDVQHVPIAVVLEDASPTAVQVTKFTQGSTYFSPRYVYDMRGAEQLMKTHDVSAILRVPSDFSSKLANKEAQIQLITNGSDAMTAKSVQMYVESSVLSWAVLQGVQTNGFGQVQVVSRLWFNDANTSTWFFVPGILMLVLTIVGVFLTSVVMAREWERGTFESLFVTPVHIGEIILSKMIPYFTVAFVGLLLCLLTGRLLYDLPIRGSFIILIFVSWLYLNVALGLGLLISAITKNQFLSCQVSIFVSFLPSVMLSGFIFDLNSVPMVVNIVGHLFPTTYYLQVLKSLLLVGDYWPLILKNSLILIGYIVLFFTITLLLTRKQVE